MASDGGVEAAVGAADHKDLDRVASQLSVPEFEEKKSHVIWKCGIKGSLSDSIREVLWTLPSDTICK